MGSNNGGKIPIHHHHQGGGGGGGGGQHHYHFFYVSPHCPLHRSILQPKNHSPSCSFSTTYPSPQNSQPKASIPPDSQLSFLNTHHYETFGDDQIIHDENEVVEDEEEEDPIFVLTDEWRDFFAKSEAKRRLAKKQAKKGKK